MDLPSRPTAKAAWPTNPAALMVNLKGQTGRTTAVAFSPDRCLLASGAQDNTGRVWEFGSRKPGERAVLKKDGDPFASVAFSPNSRWLVAGSGALNGTIWVFDVSDKTAQDVITLRGAKGAITALAFSPDNKLIASGGEDHTLRIWEPVAGGTGTPKAVLKNHTSAIKSLAFAASNTEVATASLDKTARLWTLSRIRSTEKAVLPHETEVLSVAYVNSSTLATGSQDKVIRLWDLTSIKPKVKAELLGHTGPVRLLHVTADGKTLVSVGDGPKCFNWDLGTNKVAAEWQLPPVTTTTFAVTIDGRYLAHGTPDGNVDVHRIAEKRA
ncbi:serine threonine protein kinase : Ser/Thr protein kinase OS=Arthrospira sp. PCC 8005 GN=ARTHRO_1530073 PE=4 SV=1: WD40: WD40: WD40: WD40: WD40 [Gemmataceae bacterium]|nr:serine threonine protein kinase : Ser/Thr protein kinase OS=Arthrospira sp. PCC 8005 GN=ARTHRO_1530073 PE=4 SV=1: WD40: WD40: WD40: WD40: WD40 [Gemmataceae bacterium]VTT99257.1 serine threonine protein kinase : Ser/Thr protein kinase OS=Arthrospira sp. PCC 8005 GN=ARTHRO_1530073 PE=4 SV=1: WD40: WD40: WD40: WD40: WD40 [Gemmataceae bacterium]